MEAAARNLDHFDRFLFLLVKLDAASRAICCWLSWVQHLGWKFKMWYFTYTGTVAFGGF